MKTLFNFNKFSFIVQSSKRCQTTLVHLTHDNFPMVITKAQRECCDFGDLNLTNNLNKLPSLIDEYMCWNLIISHHMIIYIVKSNFWNKHKLIYIFGCDYAVTLPHSGALGPQFTCSSSFCFVCLDVMVDPLVILPHHGVGPHSTFGMYGWKALNGVEYTFIISQ